MRIVTVVRGGMFPTLTVNTSNYICNDDKEIEERKGKLILGKGKEGEKREKELSG